MHHGSGRPTRSMPYPDSKGVRTRCALSPARASAGEGQDMAVTLLLLFWRVHP
jgi:hypothetical protein